MRFFQRKVLGRPAGIWLAMLACAFASVFCAFELLRLEVHFRFLSFGSLRNTLMLIILAHAGSCMLLNLLALIGMACRRFWGFVAGFMAYSFFLPAPALLLWLWGIWGLFFPLLAGLSGYALYRNRRWFDEDLVNHYS